MYRPADFPYLELSLLAACRESEVSTEWFFSEKRGAEKRLDEDRAKAVCARCPVAPDCLATALRVEEAWGVFGGLTAKERRRMTEMGMAA